MDRTRTKRRKQKATPTLCRFLLVVAILRKTTYYPQGDSNPLPISRKGKPCKEVTETAAEFAAHSLAHDPQIDPDLARLIDGWPSLPPTVKRMILAALEAGGPGKVE